MTKEELIEIKAKQLRDFGLCVSDIRHREENPLGIINYISEYRVINLEEAKDIVRQLLCNPKHPLAMISGREEIVCNNCVSVVADIDVVTPLAEEVKDEH